MSRSTIEKTAGVDIKDAERLVHHLDGLAADHPDDQMRLANTLAGEVLDPAIVFLAQTACA